jgi:GntR family transcriptional regulator
MVQTSGLTPRAEKARSALQFEIEQGRFAEAELLPGERDLANHLSVSRTTLRRAIGHLIGNGLLYQRQGFGTYIRRAATRTDKTAELSDREKPRLKTFVDDLMQRGLAPSFRDVAMQVSDPTPDEMMLLGLSPGERVWRLSRTVLANDAPLALEQTIVPFRHLVTSYGKATSHDGEAEIHSVQPMRILQRIRSIALDQMTARKLGLKEYTTGFFIERLSFHADGRCCGHTGLIHHPDRFDVVGEIGTASSARL